MARVFSITAAATSVRMDAQGHAECCFTVSNTSQRRLRGRAEVKVIDPGRQTWFTVVGESERDFAAGETEQFSVKIATSPESPAGKYSFRLDVVSAQNPDEDFAEGPTVSFDLAPSAPKNRFPWWIVAAAAVLLIAAGVGLYFWLRPKPVEVATKATAVAQNSQIVKKQAAEAQPAKEQAQVKDTLSPGAELLVDQSITSANGRYSLILQGDGNLVLYRGRIALWASNTMGKASKNAIMQDDGNFVVYEKSGRAVFATGTQNHPGAVLKIQDDGNAVVYQGSRSLWATNTVGK